MTGLSSIAQGIILAEPSDGEELTSVTVSPGLPGFFIMFLLAAVVVLLALDMTRRIRRLQAQERVAERHRLEDEAAAAEADAAQADGSDGEDAADGAADAEAVSETPADRTGADEPSIDEPATDQGASDAEGDAPQR